MAFNRLRTRWSHLRSSLFAPSPAAWSGATKAVVGLWIFWVLLFLLLDVIPDFSIQKLIGLVGLFVVFGLMTLLLWLVFQAVGALDRSYRRALFLALPPTLIVFAATWALNGVLVGAGIAILALSLVVGAGASVRHGGSVFSRSGVFLLFGLGLMGVSAYALLSAPDDPNPHLADHTLRDRTLPLPDPGMPGPYAVETLTYGSGDDLHRPEYAGEARFTSHSVDGSKLDTGWAGIVGWLRSWYWGFDASALPVQGRVWLPLVQGDAGAKASFPLILMVHGNHQMESFSDAGYAYLGEHLASHGFIFVSVDQNFLNTSMLEYVNPLRLRMGAENNARGWLMLEHLVQWRNWTRDARHPMFNKADLEQIVLMGHSRGGEAVAIANAFNTLRRYPDDATLAFDYGFQIQGVLALAPSDGFYRPRGQATPMQNTDYLVIQGGIDGDLLTFMGASQFARAAFDGPGDSFKASLFIAGANHNQFNTDWGRNDSWLPVSYLWDTRRIMDGAAQRQITKAYATAFVKTVTDAQSGYRPLMQSPEHGAAWLPDTYLVSNYADGQTVWLAHFDEDLDPASGSAPGVSVEAHGFSEWRESPPGLKFTELDTQALRLSWDREAADDPPVYGLSLAGDVGRSDRPMQLVFSIAQTAEGTAPLDFSIVVADAPGAEARMLLSDHHLLYPAVRGQTRRIAALSSIPESEPVMQRYAIPLDAFRDKNSGIQTNALSGIRFEFDQSPSGAVVIDDIGLAPVE